MSVWFDDVGVHRRLSDGAMEEVAWANLVRVEILTTDEGPAVDDLFWVLHGANGTGCVVPSEAVPGDALLVRLQALPGFDNEAVIRAMSETGNARFLAWEK